MLGRHPGRRRAPAARDRRPADGRHEHRRRPVRPGQDVPAAGGEERACDEAGGRPPAALHRSGKEGAGRRRRRGQTQGQDRHRHRQGRRARHRQEHRHRRAPVQQLRGREHGRDGALPGHPGQGPRRRRRHHRPERADHAQPGRDAACRRRDAARRLVPREEDPAADRRGHHQPRAHRGEDRAALRRPGGLRARCLAQRGCVLGAAVRRARCPLCGRPERRLRQGARAACEQEGRRRWSAWRRRVPTRRRSTGPSTSHRSRSSSAGASFATTTWPSWRNASTGARSSRPGTWPGASPTSCATRLSAARRSACSATASGCCTG